MKFGSVIRRSDFGRSVRSIIRLNIFSVKLDRFSYTYMVIILYIKRSSLVRMSENRTFGFGRVDQPNIRNRNEIVRISHPLQNLNDLTTEPKRKAKKFERSDFGRGLCI